MAGGAVFMLAPAPSPQQWIRAWMPDPTAKTKKSKPVTAPGEEAPEGKRGRFQKGQSRQSPAGAPRILIASVS